MSRYDSYAMNVNKEKNCYSCGVFGHLTRNLNGKESLIVLN